MCAVMTRCTRSAIANDTATIGTDVFGVFESIDAHGYETAPNAAATCAQESREKKVEVGVFPMICRKVQRLAVWALEFQRISAPSQITDRQHGQDLMAS
mmetsp:Transcript_105751/g.170238  ORF Transcript_105751/g.170238 Transcript_105751/m.170238 type:complete len:99 (-) Transcript_105751:71-367(-)